MAATEGNRFPVPAQPAQFPFVSSACLRCPKCNSTDLKKVSLAYQEGLFCTVAHTRFRAVAVGGHGPDFVIGKATTCGFHQSVLSKRLNPPVKWSYRKLILWWAVAFLSIGWIVSYPVGTLVPVPTMWHFNRAEILALRNQQAGQALFATASGFCSVRRTNCGILTVKRRSKDDTL